MSMNQISKGFLASEHRLNCRESIYNLEINAVIYGLRSALGSCPLH